MYWPFGKKESNENPITPQPEQAESLLGPVFNMTSVKVGIQRIRPDAEFEN